MNNVMKILPIFLKLKLQEIWSVLKVVWPFVGFMIFFVFLVSCTLSDKLWLCFFPIYFMYVSLVAGLLFVILLIFAMIYSLCTWIKENWNSARLIFESNERKQNENKK